MKSNLPDPIIPKTLTHFTIYDDPLDVSQESKQQIAKINSKLFKTGVIAALAIIAIIIPTGVIPLFVNDLP